MQLCTFLVLRTHANLPCLVNLAIYVLKTIQNIKHVCFFYPLTELNHNLCPSNSNFPKSIHWLSETIIDSSTLQTETKMCSNVVLHIPP